MPALQAGGMRAVSPNGVIGDPRGASATEGRRLLAGLAAGLSETLRGLLVGTPIGSTGLVALAWCVVIAVAGYGWAMRLYERLPTRPGA